MENFISPVATSIRATLLRISVKAMDKCFGQMVHFIKAIGKVVSKMEKDKYIWSEARLSVDYSKIVFLFK
jgi:hypothetical protein